VVLNQQKEQSNADKAPTDTISNGIITETAHTNTDSDSPVGLPSLEAEETRTTDVAAAYSASLLLSVAASPADSYRQRHHSDRKRQEENETEAPFLPPRTRAALSVNNQQPAPVSDREDIRNRPQPSS